MLTKPIVTVLMPVFNGGEYLGRAIDSILNQTFKDFEFLIINDASTDKTTDILKRYSDPKIKTINNKINLGLTKSLNKGLRIARGEYIARMDADDISLPSRLSKQAIFMDTNPRVGLLGTSWYVIDEKDHYLGINRAFNGKNAVHFICHGSVMFRKSCLLKVGYYRKPFKYAQDYDLWLRLSEKFEIANLNKPLYKLRVHQKSISSTKREEQDLYAALALKMAKERKKFGKDSLKIQQLELSGFQKNKTLAYVYLVWGYVIFKLGNYKQALSYMLQGIKNLLIYPIYSPILKQIFCHNWLICQTETKAISSFIQQYAQGKLLDIGCGNKPYDKIAEPYVSSYTGLDHQHTLHDKSKVDILGSAYNIPSKDENFDTILCTFVLEHLEDPDRAIKETNRVLKKNGFAIYAVPLFWHLHEEPRDFYRFTRYGLKYLFEKNGFKIIKLKPLSGFWVTFGQELVYYLWLFRKGGMINPFWWLIPIIGTIIQSTCYLLDKIHSPEQFTCEYLVVAQKNK